MKKFFNLYGHSSGRVDKREKQISRAQSTQLIGNKAPLARLERATCGLGIRRSIHLSYRGNSHEFMILFLFRQGDFFPSLT